MNLNQTQTTMEWQTQMNTELTQTKCIMVKAPDGLGKN